MSDSDERLNEEREGREYLTTGAGAPISEAESAYFHSLDEDEEGVAMELHLAREAGEILLEGPSRVQLVIGVQDAVTPVEAVEAVVRRIAHAGLDSFTFAVTDQESGETHYVQAGRVISLDDIQATLAEAQDDAEGD